MRIQGPSSPQPCGCQEFCTVRATRSGCGMIIVTRPSSFDNAQMPSCEPFGFAGYCLPHRHSCRRTERRSCVTRCSDPLRRRTHAAFAVRGRNRHARPGHAFEKQGRAFEDFDEAQSRFELLGLVAQESRPAIRPGISSRRCDSIWQPLQTPSANVSSRRKNSANWSRVCS